MSPLRLISAALALASGSAFFAFHAPSKAAIVRASNSRLYSSEGDAPVELSIQDILSDSALDSEEDSSLDIPDILSDSSSFSPLPFLDEPVEAPKEAKLYVGNLNYGIEDEDLERIFSEFGPIISATHIKDREDPTRKRGFGFVSFVNLDSAEAAVAALNGENIEGRVLRVDFASNKPPVRERREFNTERRNSNSYSKGDDGNRVYVGNLDYGTDDDTLSEIFSEFGEVISCQHMADRDDPSRKRGFAFVTFTSSDQANEAVENLDGLEVDGRSIRVNIAQPRPSRW